MNTIDKLPTRFQQLRLSRHLRLALAASTSTTLLLIGAGAAHAQVVVTVPSGAKGYANVINGAQGPDGSGTSSSPKPGSQGVNPGPLTVTLTGPLSGSANAGSTVSLGLAGGQGGQGNDVEGSNIMGQGDSSYAGTGGAGGSSSLLKFTVNAGASVTSAAGSGAAIVMSNQGGKGGLGGDHTKTYGYTGSPGDAGAAGDTELYIYGNVLSQTAWSGTGTGATPGATAIQVRSLGGNGGGSLTENDGLDRQSSGTVPGRKGANGANGGHIQFGLDSASVSSAGSAMVLISEGGYGTMGSSATADTGGKVTGGGGGAGGNGGGIDARLVGGGAQTISAIGGPAAAAGATVPVSNDGNSVAQAAALAAGLQMQSLGGVGAAGNTGDGSLGAGKGGAGGNAGSGGALTLNAQGTNISTTGFAAIGVLAQSVGGPGGSGATAGGVFGQHGGSGGLGGNGGSVQLDFADLTTQTLRSLVSSTGDDSGAIVAQSIGGGGGTGGSVSIGSVIGALAVGGNGEEGGTASAVTVRNGHLDSQSKVIDNGVLIQTTGTRSAGVVAQSIGGGGGLGGTAQSTVAGELAMSIGGTGGSGGTAGERGTAQVSVYNLGIVQTSGNHSGGIVAHAIGGGGGSGGSASSFDVGAQVTMALSVGGKGVSGGNAGDVSVINDGQIITEGADSWGVLAQSVGGGGGNGGASKAETVQLANTKEAPSLNATVSVGGKGGTAGSGGNVTATNTFSVMTSGDGSYGVMAQSIGGGGGTGGDSEAIQTNVQASTFNFSLSIGGGGGGAGSGGNATVNNSGLIWTMGYDADGVHAQSVGGGGGGGGYGNSDTSSFKSASTSASSELTLSIGGGGGTGNTGGTVMITNNSGIITRGDKSRGIFAHSVGGSGGSGGGAVANGTGGKLSINVSLGGSGGSGNDGGVVNVMNTGSILTGGGDAAGIFGQSVGGGGGDGGSASSGGGADPEVRFSDYLAKSTRVSGKVQNWGDRIYAWKDNTHGDFDVLDKLTAYVSDYDANNPGAKAPEDGAGGGDFSLTLDIGAGFGGQGGSAGNGAGVVVNNNMGAISTTGPGSPGIFAQSVGGGGGKGGAVMMANNPVNGPKNLSTLVGIGGKGGSAGNGALVDVKNSGSIATLGDQSHGIFAQSIGGGGGSGGSTATQAGAVHDLVVNFGGNTGTSGNGFPVWIESVAAGTGGPSTVTTAGDDAVGIVAQSIGGGGGNYALMGTATDPGTGGAVSHSTSYNQFTLADVGFAGTWSTNCGGKLAPLVAAACGSGGGVIVEADHVATGGRDAHGILAQSIGGGGGWASGFNATGNAFFNNFTNGIAANGDGGDVTVTVNQSLSTEKDGAFGILAQSVGGAGLLAGDFAAQNGNPKPFARVDNAKALIGNGGAVNITLPAGASLTTKGSSAFGIFAQSVGGGGGLVATDDGFLTIGTAGGKGTAGAITVNVDGALNTYGANGYGVFVNSDGETGSTTNAVNVTVGSSGRIAVYDGKSSAFAVAILSNAASNTVTNNGLISAPINMDNGGGAVMANSANTHVNVINNGAIYGNVLLGSSGTLTLVGSSTISSTWAPGPWSVAAAVINNAEIDMYDYSTRYLIGTLQNNDLIATVADFSTGQSGTFHADTVMMNYGSWIGINAQTMGAKSVTVVTADNLQVLADIRAVGLNGLSKAGGVDQFLYSVSTPNNTVVVTPQSNLANAASSVSGSASQNGMAGHLDQGFTASMSSDMTTLYTQLASFNDRDGFLNALNVLGNEAVQSVGATHLTRSHSFVERMNSCPQFASQGMELTERECAWARVIGSEAKLNGSQSNVGFKTQDYTVQIGAQMRLQDDWFVGGSISADNTRANDEAGNARVKGNSFTVGAVLKRQIDNWLISGAIDAGMASYDSERHVRLGSTDRMAKASFDGQHIGMHTRVARQIPLSNWYLKPYVDLHATRMSTDGYTERDAGGLNLRVSKSTDTMLAASPMLEIGHRLDFGNGLKLHSYVSAGMTIYNDNSWGADAQLVGSVAEAGTFRSVSSAPNSRAKVNAGANLISGSNFDAKLEYSGEFASGYRAHTGSIKLSYLY